MFRWGYIGSGHICQKTAKELRNSNHGITAVYSRDFLHVIAFESLEVVRIMDEVRRQICLVYPFEKTK